jgi:hypothetical protein
MSTEQEEALTFRQLFNWQDDVVCVINGHRITKSDILENKRRRQARRLAAIRACDEPLIKPCFVWVFYNQYWIYHGWWLYVKTLKHSWEISERKAWNSMKFVPKIMQMFPCGYLPIIENYGRWRETFAESYHYPTRKRPEKQGMAIAWAKVGAGGHLMDIAKEKEELL